MQEMPHTEAAVEISDKDQEEAIRMHQAALLKLQELQGNVVQSGVDLQVKSSKKVNVRSDIVSELLLSDCLVIFRMA